MTKEILVNIDKMENRVAILEDGELAEIHISREERIVGSIYKGRVTNVLEGMQAAFIDIGLEKNAFLCLEDAISNVSHDDEDLLEEVKEISIKDQTNSNSLSGTAILPSGQKQISLQNSKLTSTSQIYLTILSGGKNQTIELLSKSSDSFTVGFQSPLNEGVTFKWWIVNP